MSDIGDITRITSVNLVIEFQPALYPHMRATSYAAYDTPQNHVTVLSLNGATTGTFKLRVNGHLTAAITASGTLAAEAVQTALEALPNVGADNLLVTGSAGGDFTITAADDLLNEFLVIEIVDDTTAPGVTQKITSQGSKWYRLDSEASSFSYTATQETTDVTGISDKARRHSSTVTDATFEISLYEALQNYRAILTEGVEGYVRVFEDGKADGKRYFAWQVLLTEVGSNFQAQEKIEISASGRRQGEAIARVGSIWKAA